MRPRLLVLALCAFGLAVAPGGCKWTGVSAVYMTIDTAGMQERTQFYTDTQVIYCVAKESSARQDATLSFIIHEVPGPITDDAGQMLDASPPNNVLHPIFATGQETPGQGTEDIVAFEVPPNGIEVAVMCDGYCIQNGIGCPLGYVMDGPDSCGIGATCCYNGFATSSAAPLVLPSPRGNYTCEVDINGELAGVAPFSIDYPPPNPDGTQCPLPPPVDGVVCAGWVMQGARCPDFNANQTCTCDGAAWKCTPN
jgi:hypothetical protein